MLTRFAPLFAIIFAIPLAFIIGGVVLGTGSTVHDYDENQDGHIDEQEAKKAVNNYLDGDITYREALLYFFYYFGEREFATPAPRPTPTATVTPVATPRPSPTPTDCRWNYDRPQSGNLLGDRFLRIGWMQWEPPQERITFVNPGIAWQYGYRFFFHRVESFQHADNYVEILVTSSNSWSVKVVIDDVVESFQTGDLSLNLNLKPGEENTIGFSGSKQYWGKIVPTFKVYANGSLALEVKLGWEWRSKINKWSKPNNAAWTAKQGTAYSERCQGLS